MDRSARLDLLASRSSALVDAAARDLDASVPTCPEWNAADLLRHIGLIHRKFGGVVADGLVDRPPAVEAPADDSALPQWARQAAAYLVAALREADDEAPAWAPRRPVQDVAWVLRRMTNETLVHCWDAQCIAGDPDIPAADVADDLTDEFLQVYVPTFAGFQGSSADLVLRSSDTGAAWCVAVAEQPPLVSPSSGPGDATLTGSSADLAFALWGRLPLDRLAVHGDLALAQSWWEWLAGVRR